MYTRYFWYPNYYNGGIKDAMWPKKWCLDKMSCTLTLTNILHTSHHKVHLVSDLELSTVSHGLLQQVGLAKLSGNCRCWNFHFLCTLRTFVVHVSLKCKLELNNLFLGMETAVEKTILPQGQFVDVLELNYITWSSSADEVCPVIVIKL